MSYPQFPANQGEVRPWLLAFGGSSMGAVPVIHHYHVLTIYLSSPSFVCVVCLKWTLRRLVATAAVVPSLVA